ncbi:MAG TPA: RDD family protein, partial [Solirubrobacteraceae bacterium]|nr:RDD family protein [Solirubrobacteraceae bacterium]
PIAFEVLWRGRTPGKAAMGLRVVTREGGPVRFRHASLRAVMGLVDFLLTFGAGAVVSVLVTRDDQRLGDLAAGTLVLRERVSQPSAMSVRFPPPRGLEAWVDAFDVSDLDERGYLLARAYLLRAASLPLDTRQRLGSEIAEAVVAHVRTPPPPARIGPAVFLQCAAAAYQARHAPVWVPPPGAPGPAAPPPAWAAGPAPVQAPRPAPALAAEDPPPRDADDGGGFAAPS